MPIQHPVAPSALLLCDYSLGGFSLPEMIKKRPAIVISPRLPHRDKLCTVVPLSTTSPEHVLPYIVEIKIARPLPKPFDSNVMWAKCDMLATVGFKRLDLFRDGRTANGKRKYIIPKLAKADFMRVQKAVLAALGLGNLEIHLT